MSKNEKQNSRSVIRDQWNAQADEYNQFDTIGKEEVEKLANAMVAELSKESMLLACAVLCHKDDMLSDIVNTARVVSLRYREWYDE